MLFMCVAFSVSFGFSVMIGLKIRRETERERASETGGRGVCAAAFQPLLGTRDL